MSKLQEYSRESFDKAQQEYKDSIEEMNKEIEATPADWFTQIPYTDLPSQEEYYRAASKKFGLLDQAEAEAHRLENKHRELIKAVEDAIKSEDSQNLEEARSYLFLFEKNELDLHRNENTGPK